MLVFCQSYCHFILPYHCIDCVCMQMYFKTWKYIYFWGARSIRSLLYAYKLHNYTGPRFSKGCDSVGTFRGSCPPPNNKKLATLLIANLSETGPRIFIYNKISVLNSGGSKRGRNRRAPPLNSDRPCFLYPVFIKMIQVRLKWHERAYQTPHIPGPLKVVSPFCRHTNI